MHILHACGAATPHAHGLDLPLTEGWRLRLRAFEDGLLRVVVEPAEGLPLDRSWMVAPLGDVPWEGRPREGIDGLAPMAPAFEDAADAITLTAGAFRCRVERSPLRLAIAQRVEGGWAPWIEDRATGGIVLADHGRRLQHYQARDPADRFFGLGDKSGPLDRHGRRFRLLQLDALGYDAEIGDPLYKHVPYLAVRAAGGVTGGMLIDSLAPMTVDLGCERSNYHGLYRYVELEERGLDLWLLAGPSLAATTERLARLTGRPAFPPRWSFGFAFTSMHHADDPEGQRVIGAFADRCREEAIPLSAIHFGSGYSKRGRRRYVFTWNRASFPDPAALFAKLRAMGLPTVANLKPVLINDHPAYDAVAAAGGFVKGPDGRPVLDQFWDGMGSSLDFTNPATVRWWQDQLRAAVLDVGFDAGWNDNNEAEIASEEARATGFGRPFSAMATRPLQALLMTRATAEGTRAHRLGERPFTISRAGPLGIQRYGETWSGDNTTSWHTLRWNLRNGLAMALSNLGKVGHDIGGFTGPRPDPELLCRWVEMMALHPRAVMNSWKPQEGEGFRAATHPWTHPEVLAPIRAALHLRTRFLPLLYTLAEAMHRTGAPMIRPLFYDFEADAATFAETDAYMLGPDVLVAPVVEQGAVTKTLRLPAGPAGWVEWATGTLHPAGAEVTVAAPLGQPPVFLRVGAVLLLAADTPVVAPHDAPARLLVAAVDGGEGEGAGTHFEDDGLSLAHHDSAYLRLAMASRWGGGGVGIDLRAAGGAWPVPPAEALTVRVLGGPPRPLQLTIAGGSG